MHLQPERQAASPIQRRVGQHSAHQRLIEQPPLEGGPVAHPMMRLAQGGPHQTGRGDGGVQPGLMDHLDEGANACALLPDPMRQLHVFFQKQA